MSKITSINKGGDPGVVVILAKALELAKKGKTVAAVVISVIQEDGDQNAISGRSYQWVSSNCWTQDYGMMKALMEQRMQQNLVDGAMENLTS